jgi:hypothetical protein
VEALALSDISQIHPCSCHDWRQPDGDCFPLASSEITTELLLSAFHTNIIITARITTGIAAPFRHTDVGAASEGVDLVPGAILGGCPSEPLS